MNMTRAAWDDSGDHSHKLVSQRTYWIRVDSPKTRCALVFEKDTRARIRKAAVFPSMAGLPRLGTLARGDM
jgi:hypothetical protein